MISRAIAFGEKPRRLRTKWFGRRGGCVLALLLLAVASPASDRTVIRLGRELGTADRDGRREASYQLSRMGPGAREALPSLIQALQDSDKQVWSNAITAIANLGPDAAEAIPALIAAMSAGREGRRREKAQLAMRAAYALSRIGVPAVPALTRALDSDDPLSQAGAARAVGMMGPTAKDAIPALVNLLGKDDGSARAEAIEALGLIGQETLPALQEALRSPMTKMRGGAAAVLSALGRVAGPAASQICTALESESDMAVRGAMLGALARTGEEQDRALKYLMDGVRHPDAQLRHAAINALLSSRDLASRALPQLTNALESTDDNFRKNAARVLALMGPRAADAIPALIAAAQKEPQEGAYSSALAQIGQSALTPVLDVLTSTKGDDSAQREWIFRTLREMGGLAQPALGEALRSPLADVRAGAARALGDSAIDRQSVVKQLMELTSDPDGRVRAAALRALAKIQSQRQVMLGKLERALQDADPEVRAAAAHGLAAIGAAKLIGVPGLIGLLDSPERATQYAAVEALGTIGAAAAPAVDRLLRCLDQPMLQFVAVESLGKIGVPAAKAVPRLVPLARGSDVDLRTAAVKALGDIRHEDEQVFTVLCEGLRHSNRELRVRCIEALVKTESDRKKLLPPFQTALNDESLRVRRAAAEGLKTCGESAKAAVPDLVAMLERDIERAVALDALKAIRVRSVPDLVALLNHSDTNVRKYACEALGDIGPEARDAIPLLEQKAANDAEPARDAIRDALRRIVAVPAGT